MNFVNIGQHAINLDAVADIDWYHQENDVVITMLSVKSSFAGQITSGVFVFTGGEAATVRRKLKPFFEKSALLTIEL